jgi:glycosyltransferase involved in cell wall biosynthesis
MPLVPLHGEAVQTIKIHFTYSHVDKPWGGANNFIRALRQELENSSNFTFTDSPEEYCDVVFMNQLGTGPGDNSKLLSISQAKKFRDQGRKLVVRAVNLNWHAFRFSFKNLTLGWWRDRQTIALLNLADVAIFQSEYQRQFFVRAGYRGGLNEVIHNGAPPEFWIEQPSSELLSGPLRLISSTASPRETKRHDLIARISECDGVEILHMGAWPEGLPTRRVQLLGMLPREQMIEAMASCHFFLHTAIKDPCPNAVFEALCSGLPVIYNPGPGSSEEIVGACGIALDEEDLARTIAKAYENFNHLRSTVLSNRTRYTARYAAARYRKVFEQQAATATII